MRPLRRRNAPPAARGGRTNRGLWSVALLATFVGAFPNAASAQTDPAVEFVVALPASDDAIATLTDLDGDAVVLTEHPSVDGTAVVSASLTRAEIAHLRRSVPGVVVAEDSVYRTGSLAYAASFTPITRSETRYSWALDRIDARALAFDRSRPAPDTGAGVTIYVLDTGLRPTDEPIRTAPGFNVETHDPSLPGAPGDTTDCDGHGTHVASVAAGSYYGVAPGATVVPVRVLDCTGAGSASGVIAGLDWVAQQHRPGARSVINMSLSGPPNRVLDEMVEQLAALGVVVVAAAGNDDASACSRSPGQSPSAITVAASSPTDQLAWFSNTGSCVDLVAPGVSVPGAFDDLLVAEMSGTSAAAPLVAGAVAARWAAAPDAPAAAVMAEVLETATTDALDVDGTDTADRLVYTGAIDDTTAVSTSTFVPAGPMRIMDTRHSLAGRFVDETRPVTLPTPPHTLATETVTAVSLNVTVTDTSVDAYGGFVSVHPCGAPAGTSLVNFTSGDTVAGNGVFSVTRPGVCITVRGTASVVVDLVGWHRLFDGAGFVPMDPVRVADSRSAYTLPGEITDGVGVVDLEPFLRAAGHDPSTVAAVWVNVTAVAGPLEGYLSVTPCNATGGGTSTVNFAPGRVVANGGLYSFGDGRLCVATHGTADVLVDLTGVLVGPDRMETPTRVADSRHGTGGFLSGRVGHRAVVALPEHLPVGVPVVLNLTAVDATAPGWAVVTACERDPGVTSSVNFHGPTAVANTVVVVVGPSRMLCLNVSAPVHLIVDHTATIG